MEYIITAILGVLVGSFSSVLIYRLPREMPIIFARSECPKCQHKLSGIDLIPLIWRKCRYCHAKISYKYLAYELITMLIFMGWSIYGTLMTLLIWVLFIITIIDIKHYIIPPQLNIAVAILGVVYYGAGWTIIIPPLIAFISCMAIRYIMQKWKKTEGLGLGDVKFLIAASFFIDIYDLPIFMISAGIIGIISALLLQNKHEEKYYPFAPSLTISLLICVII